jgi:uncharacterized protein (DUF849 family)
MNGSKVIICAALAGPATMKTQNPAVPYSPAEFAEEAARCFEAGAAMVHVHARTDETVVPSLFDDPQQINEVCF